MSVKIVSLMLAIVAVAGMPAAGATVHHPLPFGYKTTWYAAKNCAPATVIRSLHLSDARLGSWSAALSAMDGNDFDALHTVLVAPIDGWTLAVGDKLAGSTAVDAETPLKPLVALSSVCGEAQLYASNRDHDWYMWSRAVNGKVLRAFEFDGSIGETLHDLGKHTREERGVNFVAPTESDVVRIAGKWSIDPTKIRGSQDVPQPYIARQP